ncbi:hypothetical protein ACQR1W_15615 [Bradyrhizobium sp. HKCCYLS1011]|uniref:hypothetical protein n=1 Tax=Bradyrhizobium sp. HKCCYLS1011 TaxID=3420733 RepID=UPI003EBE90FF
MFEEFDAHSQTRILRDDSGVARALSHDRYVRTDAPTAQLAAGDYLNRYGKLLGLQASELKQLFAPLAQDPTSDQIEFRLRSEKHQFDLVTMVFSQTCFGLPVWEAGLAVTMKENPLRIVGAQTTQHPDPKVKRPSPEALSRSKAIDLTGLARSLGLDAGSAREASFSIDHQRLMIYRYDGAERTHLSVPAAKRLPALQAAGPGLPLPPVHGSIREGEHYVVTAVYFRFDTSGMEPLHWVALVEVETGSVLLLLPFADSVTGMVFMTDPVTLAGGPLPNAASLVLNPVRSSVTLAGLSPPVNGTQSLSGSNVILTEIEAPTIADPQISNGMSFDFDARSNDFAAVNAYHNCDRFYRLLEDLGFDPPSYLPGTTFPSPVDHRGHADPNDPQGIEINAHCVGNAGGVGIGYTSFALADLGDLNAPIGLACDLRVAMHELFGHGVLFNHVGKANFRFSHSAGDSFATVLNDPGSQAQDRYLSFPWITAAGRRHDRAVVAGFGWSGNIALHPFDPTLDYKGYGNEQILSTTMFRIYQSIGGDSTDIAMKQFAARVVCYLMLTAIGGMDSATNPPAAEYFADALRKADAADWLSEGLSGGAYGKVIRWGFEKQGMYQPNGVPKPNNNVGTPPDVDVYIEDGRGGEYQFQPNHWSCQAIWNRRLNDGGAAHEEPVVGVTNYAYVKVKNRGTQIAVNVTVRAFHCQPSAGLTYPDDWQPMTTAQLPCANVPPNSSAEILVGPFEWVPSQIGHECMFMVVSALNDPSNIDNFTATDSIAEWRLVPNDNNIGQRNVAPVSATRKLLVAGFDRMSFHVKNPLRKRARMTLTASLPLTLVKRDWRIAFANAGSDAFTLEPGNAREIKMRILPGKDFDPDDFHKEEEPVIRIEARADGILVGGMSYPLVTKAKKAVKTKPQLRGAPKSQKSSKSKR